MTAVPLPSDEAARLSALYELDVLDSPAEVEFDALVKAAALVCGVPTSIVSLIDADRQWFKASVGVPEGVTETPRDLAFCAHAILGDGIFEVPDAALDPRFAANPMVVAEPHVRFYAGAPLRLSNGAQVGTLCVVDSRPRRLDAQQREVLSHLAEAAVRALEGRRALRERNRIGQDLQASEAQFRGFSDASPHGVFAVDENGALIYTNARYQAIFGLSAEECRTVGWARTLHPQDRDNVLAETRRAARERRDFDIEHRVLHADGSTRHVHARGRALVGSGDRFTRYVGSLEDVTERLQAERSLRDERQRLAYIIEGTGVGTWEFGVQSGAMRINETWARMLGYTLAELMPVSSQLWLDLLNPDDLLRVNQVLDAHLANGSRYECEVRMRHRDGHWVWLLTRGCVLTWSADGRPEWMFGTHMDLTARKQQEEALRKSANFLHRTGEIAGVGGWETDIPTHTLYWSDQAFRVHGLEPGRQPSLEEALNLFPPEQRHRIADAAARAERDGVGFDLEVPLQRPDGRQRWLRMTCGVEFEHDRPMRLVGAVQDITEQVEQRRAIEQANQRIALATDSGGIGIWELDMATQLLSVDASARRVYGLGSDAMTLSLDRWRQIVHPDDVGTIGDARAQAFLSASPMDTEFRVVWPDGSVHHLRATARAVRDGDGPATRLLGVCWDVTPLRQLSAELAEQHELLRVTLESIGDAVLTTDATGQVTWLNPAAERMTGWPTAEASGRALGEVLCIVDEATREPVENPVAACLERGAVRGPTAQALLISRLGEEFGIQDTATPIRKADGTLLGVVLVFHDVTEQRRLAGEMSHRARHDALTGLVNRAEFETRLRRSLQQAHEDGSEHALLFIDLDQFKLVNDACGHAVGDQLLQQVSRLLTDAVRSRDTLARLGGDEFAIILEHCNTDHAQRAAQAICSRMDDFRFLHEDRRFRIGVSIGLVPLDRRWPTAVAAMQAADTSCYAAKEAGRNRVHVWFDTDAAMRVRKGETQWAARLEQALDENRFMLFGQRIDPLGEAECGRSRGLHAEALLRMVDTDGSLVAPGAFLPAAERFQFASRIDHWVLRRACAWLGALDDLAAVGTLCVNLSGQSIGDRAFHRHALDILTAAGDAVCQRLCLEITETAAVTNLADATRFIEQVHALGVRIALDDFGAGASSFGYLKSLKVDVLKIDGQFVQGLLDDPLAAAAVRCFVDVARVMGLTTVAEFVDRPELLTALAGMGVDFAQGFLLHRPEPLVGLIGTTRAAAPQPATVDGAT